MAVGSTRCVACHSERARAALCSVDNEMISAKNRAHLGSHAAVGKLAALLR
jgi:hypothetical protein